MRKTMVLVLASLGVATSVAAGELAGVTMPERKTVNGQVLQLNGMGLRKKAVFKVYVGALYLAQKSSDPAAILAADQPRQMVMHFVRSVGKDKLVEVWKEGFAANAPQSQASLAKEIDTFLSFWRDVEDGTEILMTYMPGKGTTVTFAGKEQGTIPGKAFADAILSAWLGPKPPSEDLKAGLLGK